MNSMSVQTFATLLAATGLLASLPNVARADFPNTPTILSDVAERVTPAVVK